MGIQLYIKLLFCIKHLYNCLRVCYFFLTTQFYLARLIFHLFVSSPKVLAGMNVHPAEFDGLKQEYNVKGYPTFCFFE